MGALILLKKVFKSELFRGGATLLTLIIAGHFLNYIFHFTMARMLGPSDYGVLAVLINLTYIFGVPSLSIQTVMSRHTTKLRVKNELGRIKGLFYYMIKRFFLIGMAVFIIFAALSYAFLSEMLDISNKLLILTGTLLLITFVYPVGTGILQGMKKFRAWGWNFIIDCAIRLAASILLIFFGFGVYGPIIGTILGFLVAFAIIFPITRKVMRAKAIKNKAKVFTRDNLAVFLAMLFIVILYSIDVLVVKRNFPAEIVGKYAIVSLIGKMILFAMMAVGNAMFPISSERFVDGNKKKAKDVILKVGSAALLLCSIAVIILLAIPEFIIRVLFGSQYLDISGLLVYSGVTFSVISLIYLFILYKISIEEIKAYHSSFLAIFLATLVIFLSKASETIKQFSLVFMASIIVIFIGCLVLIRKWEK